MNVNTTFLRLSITGLWLFLQGIAAQAQPVCAGSPVRKDNSWQNWVVENRCGFTVYFEYKEVSRIGGYKESNSVLVASPCTTSSIQTFKDSAIIFTNVKWDDSKGNIICTNVK